MIISHQHRFIFIHLHKTAGDSICDALRPHLARSDFVLASDFQAWVQKHWTRPPESRMGLRKHSPAVDIRARMEPDVWNSYYKFAFVRHPFDRATSMYKFAQKKAEERKKLLPRNLWYVSPPGRRTDPLHWTTVRAYQETDSFSSFLRYPGVFEDRGMHPQIASLVGADGAMMVDFVGHFEQLDDDFKHVLDAIGLTGASLGRKNVSDNSRDKQRLSAEDQSLLAEHFDADLKAFGYLADRPGG